MTMSNFRAFTTQKSQSGNAAIIALVALVVVAVGALAFLSGKMTKDDGASVVPAANVAAAAGDQTADVAQTVIEPGNPVVAKVDGQDITRLDVFSFIQTLPPNTRQMPVEQLFPLAVDQVVNAQIINEKVKGVNLDSDPLVKEQLAAAKANIVRNVFMQKEVEKKVTDERLQQVYETYKDNFPELEEAKASHILVADEALATDLIAKLEGGADFAALAKENSTDGTAENGGDLGYFAANEVVPEFAAAAFALNAGEFTKTPVKSEFGYHIIKLEEKRQRPPATFEQAKAFLEGQLRRAVLDEVVFEWRRDSDVERFDINGKDIEPAAGE